MTKQELINAVLEFPEAWDSPDSPEALYEAVQRMRIAVGAE